MFIYSPLGESFRFGRHPDCEQSFPKDFRISGVHATLRIDEAAAKSGNPPSIIIVDSSVNGTFVNGVRVPRKSQCTLSSGDEIFLVIPNQKLLQRDYTGSLTTNFVGYFFEFTDEPQQAGSILPPLGERLERLRQRGRSRIGSDKHRKGRSGSNHNHTTALTT